MRHNRPTNSESFVRFALRARVFLLRIIIATANICFSFQPTCATPLQGPKVEIGSTKKDFGEVFAGEELEQNFPVRNLGSKPLELSQKSALGMMVSPGARLQSAVWRPNQPNVARAVAVRAAPS